ncbi:MAG: ATP-binding protein [Pseudobdellovibrio sp.]
MLLPDGLTFNDFAHLKTILDEATIVVITDSNGLITYANKNFCDISQYTQQELIGQNHRVLKSNHHSNEFFVELWQTISSGKTWKGEIKNLAKDGSTYWVHTLIIPIMKKNKPDKYVSVRYDITEKKIADEKLTIYASKLETSNKELQNFASIAAHDLQEPLRKLQTFSDRLMKKTKDFISEENIDYLKKIANSANRMQLLINDLLAYSRVTTKSQPFSVINLNLIVAQVVSDLEVRIEQTKGNVQWGLLPSIEADSTQMYQLFQNLLSNALKFVTPETVPCVTIDAKVFNLSESGVNRLFCQININDNGIGFDEIYLDRIFTIFQRLHGRNDYEGTGIGLAICRKITDRHGGSVTAKSTINQGSNFIITLPLKQLTGESI